MVILHIQYARLVSTQLRLEGQHECAIYVFVISYLVRSSQLEQMYNIDL